MPPEVSLTLETDSVISFRDICPQAPNPAPWLPSCVTFSKNVSSLIFKSHTPKGSLGALRTLKCTQQLGTALCIIPPRVDVCILTRSVRWLQQPIGEGYRFQNTTVQIQVLPTSTITSVTSDRLLSLSEPLCLHAKVNTTNGKARNLFPNPQPQASIF